MITKTGTMKVEYKGEVKLYTNENKQRVARKK